MWIDALDLARHSAGLTTRPTSCAATTRSTRPSPSRMHDLGREAVGGVGLDPRHVGAPSAVVSSHHARRPRRRCRRARPGVDPASRSARSLRAALRAPRGRRSSVAREPVVWPQPSAKVESTLGRKQRGRQPGHLDRELHQHGQQPLAHLGVAVVERDGAVASRPPAGPAPLRDAVADAAVLEAAGDPDRLPARRAPRSRRP